MPEKQRRAMPSEPSKRGCLRRAVVQILSASFRLLLGVWILIQVRTIYYNLRVCVPFAHALACTLCF